jgi:hypothetical protein
METVNLPQCIIPPNPLSGKSLKLPQFRLLPWLQASAFKTANSKASQGVAWAIQGVQDIYNCTLTQMGFLNEQQKKKAMLLSTASN